MKPELILDHIGVNARDHEEAMELVQLFCRLLGTEPRIPQKGSPYAGRYVEVVPGGDRGAKGHLAFRTDDLPAAAAWFADEGIELDWTSAKYNPDGSCYLVYLKEEPAGYAIHLLGQKKF